MYDQFGPSATSDVRQASSAVASRAGRAICVVAMALLVLSSGCRSEHEEFSGPSVGERDHLIGNQDAAGPAQESGEPGQQRPAPVNAEPEYASAADSLIDRLEQAHPDVRFELDWTRQRLEVRMFDVQVPPPEAQPDVSTQTLFRSVIRICLRTPSPPTEELWISAPSDGGRGEERGAWAGYEKGEGIHTPHPDGADK